MKKFRKMALIYNPVSGMAAFRGKLDEATRGLLERGFLPVLYRTREGDGFREIGEFLKVADSVGVLVAGGDGTLHLAINALIKEGLKLPVGLLAAGTTNDFASYLAISPRMEEYLDVVAAGRTRSIDLGEINGEYFINVVSAGSLSAIAHEAPRGLKKTIGRLAYYIQGLRELPKLHSVPISVTAEGHRRDMEAYLLVVTNTSVVAGMHNVAEGARPDDGKLDFLAVLKGAALVKLSADLLAGKPVALLENVCYIQAQSFEITAKEPLVTDVDGEKGKPFPLSIKTHHKAIEVYC